jgi:voltage-gated potassium channel
MSYVLALTVIICFVGAAGVYTFENPLALQREGLTPPSTPTGIGNYGEAVWWTAMMLTTMGSDYFPRTTEGRIIAWLLALYAFAIFGYITATVASLIIKVDQQQKQPATQPSGSETASKAPDQAGDPENLQELQLALRRVELQLRRVLATRSDRP